MSTQNAAGKSEPLAQALGFMADAMVRAKLGPSQRFFSRKRVDELVRLLLNAEGAILVLDAEVRRNASTIKEAESTLRLTKKL